MLESIRIHCFHLLSLRFGLSNSVFCPFPYGVMQETLFPTSSVSGKYNNHATILSFRSPWWKRRCFLRHAEQNGQFVGCFLPFFMPFDCRNDFFSKISVRKWHILICFLYFCRAFAIKAIADIIKGVNYALYIGHSERRKFKLIINGIAEKMSRVSCIINPRSVPRRAIPQRHTFEAYITFSVRFYLLVNNQWFFLRPRMTDGQV